MMNKTASPSTSIDMKSASLDLGASLHDEMSLAGDDDRNSKSTSDILAARETSLVKKSKLLVYLVIFISATVAGMLTYRFVEKEEKDWYADELEEFAEEVYESTRTKLVKMEDAAHLVADAWTSEALSQSTTSPNVLVQNFGVLAQHVRPLGNAEVVAVAPLIAASERASWEAYMTGQQDKFYEDQVVLQLREENGENFHGSNSSAMAQSSNTTLSIWGSPSSDSDMFLPISQLSPIPKRVDESPIMGDLFGQDWFVPLWDRLLETQESVFSPVLDLTYLAEINSVEASSDEEEESSPQSLLLVPLFDRFLSDEITLTGAVLAVIDWQDMFDGLLEDEAQGMIIDVEYQCPDLTASAERHAFRITETGNVQYLGTDVEFDDDLEDLSSREYVTPIPHSILEANSDSSEDRRLSEDSSDDQASLVGDCGFFLSSHASDEYVEYWQRDDTIFYPIVVASIFVFTWLVFVLYDVIVQVRNKKVVTTAARSTAIVTSLFPKNVAAQMLQEENHGALSETAHALSNTTKGPDNSSKPIANLFRESTILFADIAGFTAWSSMREPGQVFRLLETIFNTFDMIAERHSIFKVETVGDCYVAVCGVPDPKRDHAVKMARFAQDCLVEMGRITKNLESALGPDTSKLQMRFGLHSGPVTAGVLRGQRARFQLFGDTMNKASRIETSGKPGRIHISKETADILIGFGYRHWVTERQENVNLKGLGEMKTFWLRIPDDSTNTTDSSMSTDDDFEPSIRKRSSALDIGLINWHTEVLSLYLRQMNSARSDDVALNDTEEESLRQLERHAVFGHAMADHCIDFVSTPSPAQATEEPLTGDVGEQLEAFVKKIAKGYNAGNSFHNFNHAGHVVMSVAKLLSQTESSGEFALKDPMAHFALILAALVHDVDHPGVGNQQLVEEGHPLSKIYNDSFAERNSLDYTWSLLRQDCFHDLRRAIYSTPEEFERFRQILVHALLVTDIMDQDLQRERTERWNRLFANSEGNDVEVDGVDQLALINKRKTAVFEHIIQASDVAHTMQHWNVYKHWNQRLFREMTNAFKHNRGKKDPKEFWYKGEFGFFDFYVLPLARRLSTCPAFGASGDELLQYAISNRAEWEAKGKDVVMEMSRS